MLVYSLNEITRLVVKYEKRSRLKGEVTPLGAFVQDDTLTLSVRVPRALCASSVLMLLYRDDDMSKREIAAHLAEFDHAYDIYSLELDLGELCLDGKSGLFYYTFVIDTPHGVLYSGRDGSLTTDSGSASGIQLTVYSRGMRVPEKYSGGMMYQIFVDRFYDGGRPIAPAEGKVRNPDWQNGTPQYAENPGDALDNNEFFGGNLFGVADKLDYMSSLGVDTLYLCPVFEAASNHKYDAGDYEKIDTMFGGEEAFDRLVSECKSRGMKLILDGVFNHTGADSKYFNKFGNYDSVGAYNSENSDYFNWYSFESYPDKYRCWWGVKILPAVDSTNPSWQEYICGESGIIRRYLKRGIDGWRLDVADELSDEFLDKLKAAARTEDPDALVIGEVWEDASSKIAYDRRRRYFRGKQLDSVMNYPLKEAVIDFVLTRNSERLCTTARELWAHYPTEVSHALMNFLGTHDTERILTVLADVGTKEMTNRELASFRLTSKQRRLAKDRLKLAWTLLCAFPGMPCIYYGDEVGMEGGRDPFNRRPYIWGHEDRELLTFYKIIGAVRRAEPLFSKGELEIVDTGCPSQFMLRRKYNGKCLYVAVNLSDASWEIEFGSEPRRLIGKGRCGRFVTLESMSAEYFVL